MSPGSGGQITALVLLKTESICADAKDIHDAWHSAPYGDIGPGACIDGISYGGEIRVPATI